MIIKDLRVWFVNFWETFSTEQNIFSYLLKENYRLILDKENPNLLIYTRYGTNHLKYLFNKSVLKLYWTIDPGQHSSDKGTMASDSTFEHPASNDSPILPDHYALTGNLVNNHPHHYFLPYYLVFAHWYNSSLIKSHINPPLWSEKKDISFVYSNHIPSHRNKYYEELSKYFKINSGGQHLNNIGTVIPDKIEFISKHAYDLSIENCFEHGYSTEKIIQPILAKTIPIYWGYAPKCINPERYIQAPPDPCDLIRYIKYLNNNPDVAQNILRKPALTHNNAVMNEIDRLKDFLYTIIDKHIYNSMSPKIVV